jgi:hypothetical protein
VRGHGQQSLVGRQRLKALGVQHGRSLPHGAIDGGVEHRLPGGEVRVEGDAADAGGAGPVDAGGFDNAFTAIATIAAAGTMAAASLLPPGRPDLAQGPVFAH